MYSAQMLVRGELVLIGCCYVSVLSRLDAACGDLFKGSAVQMNEIDRAIRTARLRRLPDFHLRPIDVLVLHGPWGDLV